MTLFFQYENVGNTMLLQSYFLKYLYTSRPAHLPPLHSSFQMLKIVKKNINGVIKN